MKIWALVPLVITWITWSTAIAQTGAATTIDVRDESGAAISRAKVHVVATTGVKQSEISLETDSSGLAPLHLSPGTYDLSVESAGFRRVHKQLVITDPSRGETYKIVLPLWGCSGDCPIVTGAAVYPDAGNDYEAFLRLPPSGDHLLKAERILPLATPSYDEGSACVPPNSLESPTVAGGQNPGTVLPEVVEHSQVIYPQLARQARIQGDVRVRFTTNGESVKEAETVSGNPLLAKATEENVRTWRFIPHTPATFYATFCYKLMTADVDVRFLKSPAIVEIEASPPEISVYYAWIALGTWKARLTSATGSSLRTLELRYSGPHSEWLDGNMLNTNGEREEFDFGHMEDDFLAFTVTLQHTNGKGRVTFFVGTMKGNKITGTFVDNVGMTGRWTATRVPDFR